MEIKKDQGYCIDSDILIDFLRGVKSADEFLQYESKQRALYISAVSMVELWSGSETSIAKTNWLNQRLRLDGFLSGFEVIVLDRELSQYAGELRRDYNAPFADAIVAASAWRNNLGLATRNTKHFAEMSQQLGFPLLRPY